MGYKNLKSIFMNDDMEDIHIDETFQESSDESIDYETDKRFQLPEHDDVDVRKVKRNENGIVFTVIPLDLDGIKTYFMKNGITNDKVFILVNSKYDYEEVYDTINYGTKFNPELYDIIYTIDDDVIDENESYYLIVNSCVDLSGNDHCTVVVNGWYNENTGKRNDFTPNIKKVIIRSVIMPLNTNLIIDKVPNVIIKGMYIGGVKIPTC